MGFFVGLFVGCLMACVFFVGLFVDFDGLLMLGSFVVFFCFLLLRFARDSKVIKKLQTTLVVA